MTPANVGGLFSCAAHHGRGAAVSLCWLGVMPVVWTSSNRRARFNRGWPKVRAKVLARDGYRCQWPMYDENGFYMGICGAPATEVDHRQRDGVRDDDRFANLWSLCHAHHAGKTHVESVLGRYEKRRRRSDREFREHPAWR